MIGARTWTAARPWVVIDPDARPSLRELVPPRELMLLPSRDEEELPAPAFALIEPGATTALPNEAWWYLPPGATLLFALVLAIGLAAGAHTATRAVQEQRAFAKAHVTLQPRHHKAHAPLPRSHAERSPWSADEEAGR